MIHWICTAESIISGKITICCDNEAALNEVFTKPCPSNNPYRLLAAGIDLITCARDLLLQLPLHIEVKKELFKEHYTNTDRKLQLDLSDIADK